MGDRYNPCADSRTGEIKTGAENTAVRDDLGKSSSNWVRCLAGGLYPALAALSCSSSSILLLPSAWGDDLLIISEGASRRVSCAK